MIHVIKIILYLVKKTIKKLEEKIKFKVLKSYMDILRMKQENFPKIELIKFANLNGIAERAHFSFLKFMRDKPELIYNILSYQTNEENISLLFDFFINLYYGGSMNEKKIEEYVLSLIWCFLQDALNEINNENDIMKIFEKKVGYFFKYLYKQKKIKEYFYNILSFEFKTIEFNNNGKWLFEEMKNINKYNAEIIDKEIKKNINTIDEFEKNIFNQEFSLNKVLFTKKLNEFFKEEIKDENNKYIDKIKLKLQKSN